MVLLNCCSKFLATAEPMHAALWVCRRFRLDAALRLRWSSMYLDRIAPVRCEEYITCARSHRTIPKGAALSIWTRAWLKVLQKMVRHKVRDQLESKFSLAIDCAQNCAPTLTLLCPIRCHDDSNVHLWWCRKY